MKKFLLLPGLLIGLVTSAAGEPVVRPYRIVVLGDSITYAGRYLELVETALVTQHPQQEIELLNIGLPSETVSGLSEDGHAGGAFPRPSVHERLDRVLAQTKPDTVIACYGMNCGIYFPLSEERMAAYQKGMETLRAKVLATGARMIHMTPPVFDPLPIAARLLPAGLDAYPQPYAGYDEVLAAYSDWLVAQRVRGWTVLDLHTPMKQALLEKRKVRAEYTFSRDGVHPDEAGHRIMAAQFLSYLGLKEEVEDHIVLEKIEEKQRILKDAWLTSTGHKRPGMKEGLPLTVAQEKALELDTVARKRALEGPAKDAPPFPGTKSDWNGFDRYDFPVMGHQASVVVPKSAAPGKPWCWEGEFFGHKPDPDIALLGKGFHIVYLEVQNLLGCPEAVADWDALYDYLTHVCGLSQKPAVTGLSRGGLYAYNWAIANPTRVGCLYLDAPVCDFKSWPGGFGKGPGSKGDWALVLKAYGFKDDAEARAYQGNPVDQLAPLAKAGVPILHVYGDADEVVPWEENTGLVADRYNKLGGKITLITKPGVKHHPHGLPDSTPIVDFIVQHAGK